MGTDIDIRVPQGGTQLTMNRIQECPGALSSAAHLIQEGVSTCKTKMQQLPAEARAQLSQLKERLQHDLQSIQQKRQEQADKIVVSCVPGSFSASNSQPSTASMKTALPSRAGRVNSTSSTTTSTKTNRSSSVSSNRSSSSSSLSQLLNTFRTLAMSKGYTSTSMTVKLQRMQRGDAAVASAAALTQATKPVGLGAYACAASECCSARSDPTAAKSSLPGSHDWSPTSYELMESIPAGVNIRLSPRDTDTTTYSSIMSPSCPEAAELVATTTAAAHAAAARVKALAAPTVPDCVLVAAEAKATVKATKRAVRNLRSASAPEVQLVVAAARAAAPAAATAPPADAHFVGAKSLSSAAADQRHEVMGDAYRDAQHKQAKSVGAPAVVDETTWGTVAAATVPSSSGAHPLKQQSQRSEQQDQQKGEEQQAARSSSSSFVGSASALGRPAAPSMTAAAAAVYSTVAADVEDAMRQQQQQQQQRQRQQQQQQQPSPKMDILAADRSPEQRELTRALARQRLNHWLDGVVTEMHTTGVLPPHRVYLWIRRPVRPKLTKLQRLQQAVSKPWAWMKDHVALRQRQQKRVTRKARAASIMPI